jgi:hypothetical protein
MHTFTFPDQATIVAYYGTHPARPCLEAPVIANNFPSIEKVAQYFAGKIVKREALGPELKEVVIHKERVEMLALQEALEKVSGLLETMPLGFSKAGDVIENALKLEDIAVMAHAKILTDQQEGAFYTLAADGKTSVRHVK